MRVHKEFCISMIWGGQNWHSANCEEMDEVYRYSRLFGPDKYAVDMVREIFANPRHIK